VVVFVAIGRAAHHPQHSDPAARGSLIVTLMFTGPVTAPKGAKMGPHPPLHGTISYTVLEQQADAKVTGVARGGF